MMRLRVVIIDTLPEVEFWVRNPERRPLQAFWLQTPADKFYPDFVAKLRDGRCLVVEYKGGITEDKMDTQTFNVQQDNAEGLTEEKRKH